MVQLELSLQSEKDKRRIISRRWYLKNRDLAIKRSAEWKRLNPERANELSRLNAKRNPIARRLANKKWKEKNKEYVRVKELIRISKRNKFRRRNDPTFKVKELCRGRLNKCLALFKGGKIPKSASTERLLGCSFNQLVKHIENQFRDGMTWRNHGLRGWHIDHIKQICEFDITTPQGQSEAFHYTNLQPLWWNENLEKRFQKTTQ